ncbi:MAG TPA: thiamine phosphate synthase, partial [Actinomycetota bacterium]|nr:thiamine phosphate synthase [Actinomycetota bacterium]
EELGRFLEAVLSNGVDIVQMREKEASLEDQRDAAKVFRRLTDEHAALFVMNDEPDLAASCDADGVHLGQEDLNPTEARKKLDDEFLIGRSTHSPEELARALDEPVDYLGVGPVNETPTKPGREGVGLEYVSYAAEHSTKPFFVTGGMNRETIPAVLQAGASRVVVVRALTEADDPGVAARELRALLA